MNEEKKKEKEKEKEKKKEKEKEKKPTERPQGLCPYCGGKGKVLQTSVQPGVQHPIESIRTRFCFCPKCRVRFTTQEEVVKPRASEAK